MKTNHPIFNMLIRSVMAVLLGIGLALLLNSTSVAGDAHLDVIQTKTDVYRNVTMTGRNQTDIFIVHSGGMANVKMNDLDPETLWRLGLGDKPLEPGSREALAAAEAAAKEKRMPAALAKVLESASLPTSASTDGQESMGSGAPGFLPGQLAPNPEQLKRLMPFLIGILAVALLVYLFFCYCLKLIVQKTGTEAGLMIWLPILQLVPMLRAAGMSMLWFLFWISPLLVAAAIPVVMFGGLALNVAKVMGSLSILGAVTSVLQVVAMIVWCVKIVQARGKSLWVTIFLILPVTNLLAFLYLAFSSANDDVKSDAPDDAGKIVIQSAFSEA